MKSQRSRVTINQEKPRLSLVTLEDDVPLNVVVTPFLFDTYDELVYSAYQRYKEDERYINGIPVVLYGCFMLESFVNFSMDYVFKRQPKDDLNAELLLMVKRQKLQQKLVLIKACANQPVQDKDFKEVAAKVERLFNLRGRLVHSKEQPIHVPIPEDIRHDQVKCDEFIDEMSQHEIHMLLEGAYVHEYMNDVLVIRDWIWKCFGLEGVLNFSKTATPGTPEQTS